MASVKPLVSKNSRNAYAVVANPPGTRIPDWVNWLIISPSEAFLPPTISTSVIRRFSKGRIRAEDFVLELMMRFRLQI